VEQHIGQVVFHLLYAHDTFEDNIFIKNSMDWEDFLQRKDKPYLTRFKSMSSNEQLESLEQIVEASVHAQNENIEQAERRVEEKRLLKEAQRIFREHDKNTTLQALGPLIVIFIAQFVLSQSPRKVDVILV
jgi:hypothetical protein